MADLQFSRQDIEDLAQKLSMVKPPLSEQESKLLLAIFAAAADRAKPSGPDGGATLPEFEIRNQPPEAGADVPVTLTGLQEQLLNAYIPGNDFNFIVTGKIVGEPEPKIVGEPPPAPE